MAYQLVNEHERIQHRAQEQIQRLGPTNALRECIQRLEDATRRRDRDEAILWCGAAQWIIDHHE